MNHAHTQHAQAKAHLVAARQRLAAIEARIADMEAAQRKITAQRLAGKGSPESAAEFAALGGDIEALRSGLPTAQAQVTEAERMEMEASAAASASAQAMRREADMQELAALRQRVTDIEAMLCKALGRAHAVGKRLGHVALTQTWVPSETLSRAFRLGVPPTAE